MCFRAKGFKRCIKSHVNEPFCDQVQISKNTTILKAWSKNYNMVFCVTTRTIFSSQTVSKNTKLATLALLVEAKDDS